MDDRHSKRRRPATACTTCRRRRVKCGREKPTCLACKRGKYECAYDVSSPPSIVFILEPQSDTRPLRTSMDNWSDILDRQHKLIQKLHEQDSLCLFSTNEKDKPAESHGRSTTFTYLSAKGSPFSSLGQGTIKAFQNCFPNHDDCLAILQVYATNLHPLVPICYIPSLKDICILLQTVIIGEMALENVLLACAVLYAGAATSSSEPISRHTSALMAIYNDLATKVDFFEYFTASPSLQLIQAHMLYHTIRGAQLAPFAAFGFLPQTIRCAQLFGLHIDQKGATLELELRRLTWWHLVFLDVEASIASGLQSIIRPNGYSVANPATMFTGHEDQSSLNPYSPVPVAMQGQRLFVRSIHKWFEERPQHEEILKFSRSIRTLLAQIGPSTDIRTQWAQLYLQLQIDRAYCMLGLRFWQLDQFRDTTCQGEVVRTARAFLETYLKLLDLSEQTGFGWFIPGSLQPLHALVILLKHLSACRDPHSEALQSRELIEQVVSARRQWIMKGTIHPPSTWSRPGLASPNGLQPTNSNSNPRYALLWSLLNEVWRKLGWAGLDNMSQEQLDLAGGQDQQAKALRLSGLSNINRDLRNPDDWQNTSNEIRHMNSPDTNMHDDNYSDWFFDIDEMFAQEHSTPVEWNQWLYDFCEQDNLANEQLSATYFAGHTTG